MSPKVSIYVLSHNYGRYISQCLQSIQAQIFEDWELVIIDDGSCDDSWQIITKFASQSSKDVKIHRNEKAKGLKSASNTALLMCAGEYIMRVDADDWLLDNCVLSLVQKLDGASDGNICYGGYFYVDAEGSVIGHEVPHGRLGAEYPPHGACTLIKRRILLENGGYSEDFSAQDGWDLFYRMNNGLTPVVVEAPLFYYRQHIKSLTKDNEKIRHSRQILFNNIVSKKISTFQPSIEFVVSVANIKLQEMKLKSLIEKLNEFNAKYKKISTHLSIFTSSKEMEETYSISKENSGSLDLNCIEKPELHSPHDHLSLLNFILENLSKNAEKHIWAYLNLNYQNYDALGLIEYYNTLIATGNDQVISIQEQRLPIFELVNGGMSLVSEGKYSDLYQSANSLYAHTGDVIMGWNDRSGRKIFSSKIGYVQNN